MISVRAQLSFLKSDNFTAGNSPKDNFIADIHTLSENKSIFLLEIGV